ncbi:MAG: TetR/AcrR family transcriptional regulator [Solirubrobacterales bacterium]
MSDPPREELERLLAERQTAESEKRERLKAAVLVVSGERGYARMTVQDVLERAEIARSRFYREFSNLDDCYCSAYTSEIDRVAAQLLDGCGGDWRAGLEQALTALEELVVEQPHLARGIFVEVFVAGGRALDKRREVWERLSHALDGARRETAEPRHSPPPLTASFMLSVCEAAVWSFLLGDRSGDFGEIVEELKALVAEAYLGSL